MLNLRVCALNQGKPLKRHWFGASWANIAFRRSRPLVALVVILAIVSMRQTGTLVTYSELQVGERDLESLGGIEVVHGGGFDGNEIEKEPSSKEAPARQRLTPKPRERYETPANGRGVEAKGRMGTQSFSGSLGVNPKFPSDSNSSDRQEEGNYIGAKTIHSWLPKTALQLNNGSTVLVPEYMSRFHVPWFVPFKSFALKSTREANYRILYSPVRHAMSDGIGHSMAIVNYEIRVAQKLGIAYSHRVSNYSSLTESDVNAVEEFFGWGGNVGLTRSELQKEVCIPEGGEGTKWASELFSQRYRCNICAKLRRPNKYEMKHIVDLDESVSYQCVNGTRTHQVCDADIAKFLKKHDKAHTLFQLPTEVCEKPVSDSTFGYTKVYFWHKYWDRHSHYARQRNGLPIIPGTRSLSLSESSLTIAVHVRRGDFIHEPAVRKKRTVIEDKKYAILISRAIRIVQDEGGVFSKMPIDVIIFSEGRVIENGPLSSHSVSAQDKQYYDSEGKRRTYKWWEKLITESALKQFTKDATSTDPAVLWKDDATLRKTMSRVKVQLRIAEPTLQSMHEMSSSDIFIGSKSGLSTHAVWALSRGVSLMPSGAPIASEGMPIGPAKERICCTVGFDVRTLRLNTGKFRMYWHAYALANAASAARALKASS